MKVLIVLTSHDQLGDTGKKTGFWLEEFAAPYYVFKDAGAEIVLASPKGGQPPLDPTSDAEDAQTDDTRRFKEDTAAIDALAHTTRLAEVSGGTSLSELVAGLNALGVAPHDMIDILKSINAAGALHAEFVVN